MLTKYLTVILVLAAFAGGWLLSSQGDKELIDKFDQERKEHEAAIRKLSLSIQSLRADSLNIRKKMKADSLTFAIQIREKDEAFVRQKRYYESINLSRATAHELDSLRAAIFRTLHTD